MFLSIKIKVQLGWKNRIWHLSADLYQNGVPKNNLIFGSPNIIIGRSGMGMFTNLSVFEPDTNYRFKLSVNTTPPSSYSTVQWTPDFNVTERRFTVLIEAPIGDCNDTVVCGRQPVVQIRNHHPDSDAQNLDGVWTITASIINTTNNVGNGSSSSPGNNVRLLGNTTLTIDNVTGLVRFTDLRFSEPARNVSLHFKVRVDPYEHRLANLSATSRLFDVKARLLCLKEIFAPVSPKEGDLFTQQPLLHIIDCATGMNAVEINPINITASVVTNQGNNITGTTTVMSDSRHGYVVNFTDLAVTTWMINATLRYSSPDLHKNVSFYTNVLIRSKAMG